jgi:hypothetical protein
MIWSVAQFKPINPDKALRNKVYLWYVQKRIKL